MLVSRPGPKLSPNKDNILGLGSYAIIGYDSQTYMPITNNSTDELLNAFDQRTNSEIAIGYSKSTVYNSVALGQSNRHAYTYYPIGDPLIMVTVQYNGADPFGEFWKCKHQAYLLDVADPEPASTSIIQRICL